MSIIRDIFRRKGRSILTICGIAAGVFALVVLGSSAENGNVYLDRLTGYYEGVITVIDDQDANFAGMATGNRPLLMDLRKELEAYPGVKGAYPDTATLLDDDYFSVIPPMVLSVSPGMWEGYLSMTLSEGRRIEGDETGEVMLGSDLAKGRKLGVGDTLEIRGRRFTVVGVLDRTFVNVSDAAAYVPIAEAQKLYWSTLPKAFQKDVRPEELAVQYSVHVKEGVDPDALAAKLERDFANIRATGPTQMMDNATGLTGLMNGFVLAVGMVALIVCTLSVTNTMTMAVSERTREIGLKRAMGATRRRIMREVLVESALMSAIGGVVGVAVGSIAVTAINTAVVASTGTSTLLITWRLVTGALAFAVVLGLFGGLWPARHASRLDPAAALAYE